MVIETSNGAALSVIYLYTTVTIRGPPFTWCRAVSPSTLAVLISAPISSNLSTSSLSPAAHAAKKTQPEEKFTLRDLCLGDTGSRFVSDSSQRFSCSARFIRAEFVLLSRDIVRLYGGPPVFFYFVPKFGHTLQYTRHLSTIITPSGHVGFFFVVAFDRRQRVRLAKINTKSTLSPATFKMYNPNATVCPPLLGPLLITFFYFEK